MHTIYSSSSSSSSSSLSSSSSSFDHNIKMDRLKSAVLIDFGSIFLLHLRQSKEYREIVAKKISGLHSLLFADKKSHLVTLGIFIILVHTYCYPYYTLFFSFFPPLRPSLCSPCTTSLMITLFIFLKKKTDIGCWLAMRLCTATHSTARTCSHMHAHAFVISSGSLAPHGSGKTRQHICH